jgi:hypothetical protein
VALYGHVLWWFRQRTLCNQRIRKECVLSNILISLSRSTREKRLGNIPSLKSLSSQSQAPCSYLLKTFVSASANSLIIVVRLASDLGSISHRKSFAQTKNPSLYPVIGSVSGSTVFLASFFPGLNEKAHNNLAMAKNKLRSARWMPGPGSCQTYRSNNGYDLTYTVCGRFHIPNDHVSHILLMQRALAREPYHMMYNDLGRKLQGS